MTLKLSAGPGPLKYTPSASIVFTVHVAPDGTAKSSARPALKGTQEASVNCCESDALPLKLSYWLYSTSLGLELRALPEDRACPDVPVAWLSVGTPRACTWATRAAPASAVSASAPPTTASASAQVKRSFLLIP